MRLPTAPIGWSSKIHLLEKAFAGDKRFPLNVEEVAKRHTAHFFPSEAITKIVGRPLESAEGALKRSKRTGEWGIVYNSAINSCGRSRFTIAHEFGHYLLHREKYPDGVQCSEEDLLIWSSEYNQIEEQANCFAAHLLMPLGDFREQIDERKRTNFGELSRCAKRYGVSLTAATLQWLRYTLRRAVFVMSRDGYILWARSSDRAFETGRYIKVAGRPPIEVPTRFVEDAGVVKLDSGIWFPEMVTEESIFSDNYDLRFTLLQLSNSVGLDGFTEESEQDSFEFMQRKK